ncbi:major facilitator superfamily MFS_1 [Caldalkalibacillus thermarum TA2.A1]|uniref:MFS transporter n=2 Tax=Caldalkalibacillus TaxID=379065 RepID=F5L613_CALTT|nr:major facilitator superfamily MFS_1 [Caldalkalibacillus thermarum TA2.A1]QZT34815.1 MFS transporter [Caldalkalibacillus thermarum TA2.A1]
MCPMLIIFLAAMNVFMILYAPQPLLPLFAEDFGVSIPTASLTIAVTIIALAIASLLLAPAFDKWRRKKVMLFASIALIWPSVMLCITQPFSMVLFWRILYGLFIPGVTAVMMAYIAEEFPPEQRGRVMGVYVSANVAGGLLGRVISGPIAEAYSWQAVFGALALYSTLISLLIWKLLPNSQHQPQRSEQSFLVHFRNPALLGTFLIGFSQFFAFIGFFTYIPFYASAAPFQLTVTQISLLYLTYAFGILSAPIAGFLSDKIGRRTTMAAGHVIGAMGILLTLWPSVPSLLIGSSLLTLGNFASQSAATAYVTDVALESRGAATSLYLFFFYVGGSLGAWLPGFLWNDFGWRGLVVITVSMLVLALLSNILLTKRHGQHHDPIRSSAPPS